MLRPQPAWIRLVFFLCLPCVPWFLFFHRLADRDLTSSHEARAAQDAQSILDGQWALPRLFDGRLDLQKPPLYYWLVALTARLHGGPVDAWAVRLPAALAGVAGVLVLAGFCVRCHRPTAGLVAAALLATAVHYTWLGRVGRIDMPLTLAVTVALAGYYLGRERRWWLLVGYLAVAAALLLKGPIGVVLPGVVVAAHLFVEREVPWPWQGRRWLRLANRLGFWWGAPLVAVVVLPWYVWADQHTGGELFRVFLWKHNLERGFDAWKAHPWWYYGPRLAADFLPWSVLLPVAGYWFLRRGRQALDPQARFGLVWLLAMTGLLSCADFKRADYLVPAYPGAALFLGCIAERWYQQSANRARLVSAGGLIVAGCLLGWCVYLDWYLPRTEPAGEYQRFAREIRQRAPAPQRVVFFRTESHALAFHVGRPLEILVWWEDLDAFAARSEPGYVVMPEDSAREWSRHLKRGRLEPVLANQRLSRFEHGKALVVLRTRPPVAGR